jgi:hypothetical protein
VPDSVSTAGGSSRKESSEEGTSRSEVHPGFEHVREKTPQGGVSSLTAVVNIPLAYFEALAKRESGSEEEPSAAAVKVIEERERPILKQKVMRAVGLKGAEYEDCVFVGSYWAGGLAPLGGELSGGGDGTGEVAEAGMMAGVFTQYGKHIAVSALAMLALFMVLMMVRKASGPAEVTEEEAAMMIGKKPPDAMSIEDSNIEDGEGTAGLLAGVELDEEVVRSQQMLEQIKQMVSDSPEAGARLVSKWMAQDE